MADSGVDSESTTTPSSPEDVVTKEGSQEPTKAEENRVDSDVMETAEMLLSLSGSKTNLTSTTMNGSNHESKTSFNRGLKDDFIKSLRLQKKAKSKISSCQQREEENGCTGRKI